MAEIKCGKCKKPFQSMGLNDTWCTDCCRAIPKDKWDEMERKSMPKPISTPPDKLDMEAKELYKRFYTEISEVLVTDNVAERRVSKITKQCAIIHCDLMYDKLTELLKSELHNDFGIMAERGRYIKLKQKIESL